MPGGAATTAGIAVMAGMAVMVRPSMMKSSSVSPTKSGGGSKLSVLFIVGRPCNRDGVPEISRPSGVQRLTLGPHSTDLDDVATTENPLPADIDTRDAAGRDGPVAGQIEIFGGLCILDVTANVFEFYSEGVGDQKNRFAEDSRSLLGYRTKVRLVNGIAKAHGDFGCRRVVDRRVERIPQWISDPPGPRSLL